MKTIAFFISILIISASHIIAQDFNEALLFSEREANGDARVMGMGGAFGGLGANTSAAGVNPAGLGLFTKNNFSLGTDFNFLNSETTFLSNSSKTSRTGFSINNLGIVGSQKLPRNDVNAQYLNFSFSINKLNDFNSIKNFEAVNESSSMTDDFLALSEDGYSYFEYNELALDTELIMYDDSTQLYSSDFIYYDENLRTIKRYGQQQLGTIKTSGRLYEYDFTLASRFSDIFAIGVSASFLSLNYQKNTSFTEYVGVKKDWDLEEFTYSTRLSVNGAGLTGKLGFLLTPIKEIRIGGAVHTPTVMYLSEIYKAELDVYYNEFSDYANTGNDIFNYTLTTPFRLYGNLGFVIDNIALVNIDIENIDYSMAVYDANYDGMISQNKSIENLQNTTNLKVGTEIKYGPYFARCGVALYGNPYTYKDYSLGEYKSSYSAGIGILSDGFYFDIAYIHSKYLSSDIAYNTYNNQTLESTTTTKSNRILMSFGFIF
jgi:hypothetical protein